MNCRRITPLLPLYAGGDLEAREEREVSRHLLSCDECRRAAGEYEETQRWLRLHQPPEFDAAFHEGVRRAVMREVNHHIATRLAPAPLFARLFRVPLAYVLPAALLLAACGAALITLRTQPSPERAQHETAVNARPRSTSGDSTARHAGSPGEVAPASTPRNTPRRVITSRRKSERVARPPARARRHEAPTEQSIPPDTPEAARNIIPASAPEAGEAVADRTEELLQPEAPRVEVADAGPADAAPEMLRIELQTSDPNIRIIWLAPQKESSTTNNAK